MLPLRQLRAVYGKEVLEGVRDRRSLLTALVFPMLGPLTVGLLISQIAGTVSRPAPVDLPIVGAENAPGLVAWLEDRRVNVVPAPEDPERSVRQGEHPVVLRIPADYAERFSSLEPAIVEVVQDSSRHEAHGDIRRVERLLGGYSSEVGRLRLLARGVSPDISEALLVDGVDVSTPEGSAAAFVEMVDMMVLLAAFFCNMYIAIDTTAGERERRSMEPLLLNPVPRTVLVVGKWLAGATFGGAGVVVTIFATGAALARAPLEEIGARVDLSLAMGLAVFGVTVPLLLFAAALQIMVCSFARSFKEAQTLVSLTALLGMAPGMILTLNPFGREPWMMGVPVLAQQIMAGALARGEAIPIAQQALAVASTVGSALVFVAVTVALFRREQITSR